MFYVLIYIKIKNISITIHLFIIILFYLRSCLSTYQFNLQCHNKTQPFTYINTREIILNITHLLFLLVTKFLIHVVMLSCHTNEMS